MADYLFQSFHAQDDPNPESSIAGKKKKIVCSGYGNGAGPRAIVCSGNGNGAEPRAIVCSSYDNEARPGAIVCSGYDDGVGQRAIVCSRYGNGARPRVLVCSGNGDGAKARPGAIVCSGYGDGAEPRAIVCFGCGDGRTRSGASFGRGESDMKVSPKGNINIGPRVGAPWFWGGGEKSVSPNGIRGPSYGAPWTTWARVDTTMNHDDGEANWGKKPQAVSPSENINIDLGVGTPFNWGKGEFKVPPNANVIGYGAGGVKSGKMSASINYHHGTINFWRLYHIFQSLILMIVENITLI